ncbi:MAG: tetratricopeptide repeat protein [Akkermansiaceae bacterium]
MNLRGSDVSTAQTRPTFCIACWVIGLIAFAQLIALGTALNVKIGSHSLAENEPKLLPIATAGFAENVRPRSLGEILASSGNVNAENVPTARPEAVSIAPYRSTPSSTSLPSLPRIANPRVERLIEESRTYQMDGDISNAVLKLEEAATHDPAEPAIHFQKARIFEDMGLYVKAADEYQAIQQMGTKAGVYFPLAIRKLTENLDSSMARRNVISIGPAIPAKKMTTEDGKQQARVNISIRARPDTPINPDDVTVNVYFYDTVSGAGGGEIKGSSPSAVIEKSWLDHKIDWQDAGNEENILVNYTIPSSDGTYEHLFGQREYFGYVVELVYKGEVIDQQAHPRRLHSHHGNKLAPAAADGFNPWLYEGDNDGMLLPNRDSNSLLPALPELPFSPPQTSLPTR